MKKLITILALVASLLIVSNSYSQTLDSVNIEIQDINLRLDKFSRQNHVGNGLLFYGVITTVIGTATMLGNKDDVYSSGFRAGVVFGVAGGMLTTSGLVVNLNSHNRLKSKNYYNRYKEFDRE
jgi:hypothetical protein